MNAGMLTAGVGLMAGSIGIFTGYWDPRAPWFGFGPYFQDAADEASALRSDDVATDGVDIEAVDLLGQRVVPEDIDEHPTDQEILDMGIGSLEGHANPDFFDVEGSRFEIDEVGMNVPLLSMDVVGGQATPPGFRAVYALRNMTTGLDAPREGAVVLVTHSAATRFGPGNFLIDIADGRPVVPDGAEVRVAGAVYRVDGYEEVRKTELASHGRVWEDRPMDLVVVTCRQQGGVKTTHNTVLYGRLVLLGGSSGGGRPPRMDLS